MRTQGEIVMKIAIIYGSTSGNTKQIADRIAGALSHDASVDVLDVRTTDLSRLVEYDVLIAGTPTYEMGALQEDWQAKLPSLDAVDLTGKKLAVFGLGDQGGFADLFVDAMGKLYRKFVDRGAVGGTGFTDTEGFSFEKSDAVIDGKFCGLVLDEDTQADRDWNPVVAHRRLPSVHDAGSDQVGPEIADVEQAVVVSDHVEEDPGRIG